MGFLELFLIAVSLSMDAFAVSVCKGLSAGRPRLGQCLTCGVYFGGFQALMPFLGWLLGIRFQELITSFGPRAMFPLAVATSIDALAVGVTFAFLNVPIYAAIGLIGATTLLLSALGVKAGAMFGNKLGTKAELVGGLVLMGMGLKILLEHTVLS